MHVNSEYQSFEYKTNVVNEEIGAFLEVIGAFHALTELMNNNRNRQKELKRELEEVVSNPQLIYGVVKKTTKDEKINKYLDKTIMQATRAEQLTHKLESMQKRVQQVESMYNRLKEEIPDLKKHHILHTSK